MKYTEEFEKDMKVVNDELEVMDERTYYKYCASEKEIKAGMWSLMIKNLAFIADELRMIREMTEKEVIK